MSKQKSGMADLKVVDADGLAASSDDNVVVVLVVTRKEIDECNFTSSLERLLVLIDTAENARRYKNSLLFNVDGYEKDPRELYEIPEVRSFFQKLTEAWPHWLWFLNTDHGQVSVLLALLCKVKVHRLGAQVGFEFTDPAEMERVMLSLVHRSSSICDGLGVPLDEFDEVVGDAMNTIYPD